MFSKFFNTKLIFMNIYNNTWIIIIVINIIISKDIDINTHERMNHVINYNSV